jgi:hypothetical protein
MKSLEFIKIALVVVSFLGADVLAEDFSSSGHIKLSYFHQKFPSESFYGVPTHDSSDDTQLRGRLNFKYVNGNLEGVLEGLGGVQNLAGRPVNNLTGLVVNPDDKTAVFDLSHLGDADGVSLFGRIDRASINLVLPDAALRVGRMALTWGQGNTFQILDIVNPFPPATLDPEYKPGSDMIYGQKSIGGDTQVELAMVPRREKNSGDLEYNQSTVAFRGTKRFEALESELQATVAHHYNRGLLGIGYNFPWQGAIVRGDLLIKEKSAGGAAASVIANIDKSWEMLGRNWYGSVEYFHSGVGASSNQIESFSRDLSESLLQGDLYTIGSDYLSLGFRQELSPLINLNQLLIQGLDPVGTLVQLQVSYDLKENLVLIGAATLGLGGSNSEFQGYSQGGAFIERGDSLFIQIGWYF